MKTYRVFNNRWDFDDKSDAKPTSTTVEVQADSFHIMHGVLGFTVAEVDERHKWETRNVAAFAEHQWDYVMEVQS